MASKIIPDPNDAPPVTRGTLREMRDRIYEIENRLESMLSDQSAGNKGVDATTQNLSEQVKSLSYRTTSITTASTVLTGTLPNDATWHSFGTPLELSVFVPSDGRIITTFGCAEAKPNVGSTAAAVEGDMQAHIYQGGVLVWSSSPITSRCYSSLNVDLFGVSAAMVIPAPVLPEGTYQVRISFWGWASGTAVGSMQWQNPYLTVQIVGR